MTDNMFDKFVSDKLRDHQSSVPPGLWEKIERKKDKEPRGGLWWFRGMGIWAALFVLLAGVGTGYYLLNEGESNKQASETIASKSDDNGNVNTSASNKGGNNGGNDVSAGDKTDNETSEQKGNSNPINDTVGVKVNTTNKVVITSDQNKIVAKTTSKQVKEISSEGDDNIASTTNSKLNFNRKSNSFNSKKDNAGIGSITPNGGNDAIVTNDQLQLLSKGSLALMDKKKTFGNSLNLDASKLKIWGIDCPTAGKVRRNDLYVELYASPDFAMKSVSGSNTAILQKKDSVESTQIGYSAGLRFSKAISDRILLKAGLQYSQINERFDLRTENERRITTVITIRTVTTPSGTDTMIRDTTTLEQIGYSLRRTYNRYRSFDIPLLVSYEFGNEHLKFAVNGGVILNLRSWYSGETINDSLAVVSLNSKTAPTYKHNIGVGLYAGFSIIKPVSNKFDLFLEPYFRYNLGNMTSGSAYTQKFNAAGVSFGIRYKLMGQRR